MSSRWPNKTVIGLTGNIATGKSVVRRMLEHLGAFGLDADGLAHRAMSPGAPAYQPIIDNFGKWILDKDGKIDRAKLANVVFADPEALKQLEAITHPIIRQVIDLLIKRSKQTVVVIEAIKLIEGGLAEDCDTIWVVDASASTQLTRLTEDRKLPGETAKQRMSVQSPQADKVIKADTIIKNDGGYEDTFNQVQKFLEILAPDLEEEEEVIPIKKTEPPVKKVKPPTPEEKKDEAKPTETPAEEKSAKKKTSAEPDSITIKRGSPKHAEAIAGFINKMQGESLTRTDIMHRFGQKAYMLAYVEDNIVGLAGYLVENLIVRTDEFLIGDAAPAKHTAAVLVDKVESAANGLQAEISLIFLDNKTSDVIRESVLAKGYEKQQPEDLRIPVWREAAQSSAPPDSYLVSKRLREDRVLKPI